MNTKQQVGTGFLALVIVSTIALMPVNAEVKVSKVSGAAPSGTMLAALNTEELPQDQVKDLTYN